MREEDNTKQSKNEAKKITCRFWELHSYTSESSHKSENKLWQSNANWRRAEEETTYDWCTGHGPYWSWYQTFSGYFTCSIGHTAHSAKEEKTKSHSKTSKSHPMLLCSFYAMCLLLLLFILFHYFIIIIILSCIITLNIW